MLACQHSEQGRPRSLYRVGLETSSAVLSIDEGGKRSPPSSELAGLVRLCGHFLPSDGQDLDVEQLGNSVSTVSEKLQESDCSRVQHSNSFLAIGVPMLFEFSVIGLGLSRPLFETCPKRDSTSALRGLNPASGWHVLG